MHGQSSDIAMGVDAKDNKDQGAGDQGIMFGYACKETRFSCLLLFNIHNFAKFSKSEKRKTISGIQPDSKAKLIQYKAQSL